LFIVLALALAAQGASLAVRQLRQDAALRALVGVINRLPEKEQLMPIPCSRTPLTGGPEKAALQETLLHLARPTQRAMAFCLLGDTPSAMAEYEQSASSGDDGSALQVYFLQARQGNLPAAKQALSSVHLSEKELNSYLNDVNNLKLKIDTMPLAQRAVDLYPTGRDSWQLWLNAARVYESASNWQGALDAYLEAIRVQEKLGVRIGRSSFELGAGRLYQTLLKPPDLNSALSYYNDAITDMDFLETGNETYVFLFRGEVYQGLRPAFTAEQALQEFFRALKLDSKNYWALRAIAGVYLYNLKDYPSAEFYINQSIDLKPDLVDNYLMQGDIYRQQGNLQGAITAYQDSLTRQPGYQAALDRLAAVQAQLKKQAP
jgi:tetratricopeptide (TPR) repeat protein